MHVTKDMIIQVDNGLFKRLLLKLKGNFYEENIVLYVTIAISIVALVFDIVIVKRFIDILS